MVPEVLMISTYPPSKNGIASYTARLEKALRNEVKVEIAASGRDWKRNSLSYIPTLLKRAINSKAKIVHVQLSYFMFGDELHSVLFPLLVLGLKALHKKVVITFHDIVPRYNLTRDFMKRYSTISRFLWFKRWALILYTRIVCSLVDRIIVHDEIAKKTLVQEYKADREKVRIIPHGIDSHPVLSRVNNIKNAGKPIVSYFGLVRQGKGLEHLVKAWRIVLKNISAQLYIIGGKHPYIHDGYYEKLIELVKSTGLDSSIRFCGYVPTERLPTYFTATDVFVFPYNEWGEVIASSGALSLVAAYRKPIIATDVPAFYSLKRVGAALIVKRGDANSLASAILEALTNVRTRKTLIDRLNKWVLESEWSTVAKKTKTLYFELYDS